MMEASREMTLEEYCAKLGEQHRAVKELRALQRSQAFLDALYAAGVDNWDGYEEAYDMMEEA